MSSYWLNLLNKHNADCFEFFTVFSNRYVGTITKEEFEKGGAIVPKTGYRLYKIIDGKKTYIEIK